MGSAENESVRQHLRKSALALSEEERLELLARIDAEIAEIDQRAATAAGEASAANPPSREGHTTTPLL